MPFNFCRAHYDFTTTCGLPPKHKGGHTAWIDDENSVSWDEDDRRPELLKEAWNHFLDTVQAFKDSVQADIDWSNYQQEELARNQPKAAKKTGKP